MIDDLLDNRRLPAIAVLRTQKEKRADVGRLLLQFPDHSNRAIARAAAVSESFVRSARAALEAAGRLRKAPDRIGIDGRIQAVAANHRRAP